MPAVGWSVWEALLVFLVANLVLAQTVVGIIAALALGVTTTDDPKTVYVGVAVDLAWLVFTVLWLTQRHPGWREQLGIRLDRAGYRSGVFGFVAGLILYPAIAIGVGIPLTILFSALSGQEATTPEQLPEHLTGAVALTSVLLAVLVAPVVEETFFRGILFRSIRDRRGFWPGALVSGVLFGLVHWVPSPWQDAVLLQTIMVFTGIALAWIYERRGSLLANIAAHMAFNAVGIFLILKVA
ncbi:MAG: CPBP family glutamic-type intramembrane protease [Actinomycetota bacterium]|nr:CPBP family glutamic-type intramembrane protease [Actinomycetota bacterium]